MSTQEESHLLTAFFATLQEKYSDAEAFQLSFSHNCVEHQEVKNLNIFSNNKQCKTK